MRLFGAPFFHQKTSEDGIVEVNLKCKMSDTMILCACCYTPMWYEKAKAEEYRKGVKETGKHGNFARCDVCRHIDLAWSGDMIRLMDEREEREKNRKAEGGLESLYIEPIPDLVGVVAKAISIVIADYNKDPTKYESICERKLKVAREMARDSRQSAK